MLIQIVPQIKCVGLINANKLPAIQTLNALDVVVVIIMVLDMVTVRIIDMMMHFILFLLNTSMKNIIES